MPQCKLQGEHSKTSLSYLTWLSLGLSAWKFSSQLWEKGDCGGRWRKSDSCFHILPLSAFSLLLGFCPQDLKISFWKKKMSTFSFSQFWKAASYVHFYFTSIRSIQPTLCFKTTHLDFFGPPTPHEIKFCATSDRESVVKVKPANIQVLSQITSTVGKKFALYTAGSR